MSTTRTRRRMGLRTAVLAVVALAVATPALAAVIIQNFIAGSVEPSAACFVKVGGDDADTDFASFDDSATTNPLVVNGVTLLQEEVSVTAQAGDRIILTDVIRYQNTCADDLSVILSVETPPGVAGSAVNNWGSGDLHMETYLADPQSSPGTAPAWSLTSGDWNAGFSIAEDGTVTQMATPITVASGEELIGAFVIDSAFDFTSADPAPSFLYTAQATVVPTTP